VVVALVPLHRLSLAALHSAEGRRWDGRPRDIAERADAWAAHTRRITPAEPTDRALAVLGLLPGDWVASPQHAAWFADPITAPRAHIGHLGWAVLGRYRPETDAIVRAVTVDAAGRPVPIGR
jgi:hypothetical protein